MSRYRKNQGESHGHTHHHRVRINSLRHCTCCTSPFAKPKAIWNLGKIQGFVQLLSEKGTVIFFSIVGIATIVGGILIFDEIKMGQEYHPLPSEVWKKYISIIRTWITTCPG
jgi:hypothetical protein